MKKVILLTILLMVMVSFLILPVSAALDDAFSDHLLHFDGGYTDESGAVWANHGASISTGTVYFGTGALYTATGASNYIYSSASMSTYNHSTSDFTIDCWYWAAATPLGAYFYQVYANASNREELYVDGFGHLFYQYVTMGTIRAQYVSVSVMPSSSLYHHMEFTRTGVNCKMFFDGVSQSITTTVAFNGDLGIAPAGSPNVRVGTQAGYTIYIDEFRTSHICRHTTDFTPATAPYGGTTPPSSQYNLQFYVQDAVTILPMSGATVVLDGRGSSLPIYSSTTDAYGYYNLTGAPGGVYHLSVGKTGYETKEGDITIGQNQVFSSYLSPTGYITGAGISHNVVDAINQTPITGATIILDGRANGLPYFTNTTYNGSGFFLNVPPGTYYQSVSKAGYETHAGTVPITVSQLFTSYLRPLDNYGIGKNEVKFVVLDASNQTAISGASVILVGTGEMLNNNNGVTYNGFTDVNGVITFNVNDDYYNVYYSKGGYNPQTDTRYDIRTGQTIIRYLIPSTPTLTHTATFTVLDITPPNNPVPYARVWLQETTLSPVYGGITGGTGIISITNLISATYSVWVYDANNSYTDYTGTMVIYDDVTATIYLTPRNWSGIPTPTTPMAYPTWTPPASFTPIPTIPGSGPGGVPANLKEMALNFMMGFIGVDPTQASFLIGLVICFACTGVLGGISMNPGLALVGAGIGTMAAWGMGFWPPYVIIIMILLCAVGLFLFKGGGGEPG